MSTLPHRLMSDNRASSVYVFFPPRVITIDRDLFEEVGNCLDKAVKRYTEEGLSIVMSDESLKDAQKVIEFSKQFSISSSQSIE